MDRPGRKSHSISTVPIDMTSSMIDGKRPAQSGGQTQIDRVTFFNTDNKTAFQVQTVPIGMNAIEYARAFI